MNKRFLIVAILCCVLTGCWKTEEATPAPQTPSQEMTESFTSDLSKIVDDSYDKASKEKPSN